MERLIPHEEAGVRCSSWREDSTRSWRHNGIVEVLNPLGTQTFQVWVGLAVTEEEMSVAREDVVFISHRWLSKSHPDDFDNSKLGHLKRLAEAHPEWKYFWIDYLCVPQKKSSISNCCHQFSSTLCKMLWNNGDALWIRGRSSFGSVQVTWLVQA